jgi:hypothetical protein
MRAAGFVLASLLVNSLGAIPCPATAAAAEEAEVAVEVHVPPEVSLAKVRRIYVDQLGGGQGSDQMRDMLITALQNSGLFVLTENPERADALLKGSSDQKIFTEEHSTSDSIGMHASGGSGSSAGASVGTNSSSRRNMSAGITQSDSSHIQERRQEVTPEEMWFGLPPRKAGAESSVERWPTSRIRWPGV